MPMRFECRHYESRTYANGETVRKCNIDLAPDAPWRCPEPCTGFSPRRDIAWSWGRALSGDTTPDEPMGEGIAELLDAAEEIVNSAGPDILREVREEQEKARKRNRFRRKKK